MEYKYRYYTISTRLENNIDNTFAIEYFLNYLDFYSKLERRVFYDIKTGFFDSFGGKSKYITYMCKKYNVMKRTINSILFDILGRIKALKALKQYEQRERITKSKAIEKKIAELKEEIKYDKIHVNSTKIKDEKFLAKLRRRKRKLWSLHRKLNKLHQQINNYDENNIDINLCFGSKKEFNKQYNLEVNNIKTHIKWLNRFRKSRDKLIFYLGSGDETCGNQMFQTSYNDVTDSFDIKIRKENNYCLDNKDKYVHLRDIKFKYFGVHLKNAVYNGALPISYRILRKNNKLYLQAVFQLASTVDTSTIDGVVGVDYNDGFLEVIETNAIGNIISNQHLSLKSHGTGNKAKSELQKTIHDLLMYCETKGKSLVIENLDFMKTKSKQLKNTNKEYNKMLHAFDYSRYKQYCEDFGNRIGVDVILVNPYNTSKIGKQKYSNQRKLSVHQAAAYVIARRGQGFKDELAA